MIRAMARRHHRMPARDVNVKGKVRLLFVLAPTAAVFLWGSSAGAADLRIPADAGVQTDAASSDLVVVEVGAEAGANPEVRPVQASAPDGQSPSTSALDPTSAPASLTDQASSPSSTSPSPPSETEPPAPFLDWTSKGELALETRAFRDDNDARTVDRALGMMGRLEVRATHEVFETKGRAYGRLDREDRQRTVLLAEEIWAQVRAGGWLRLRAGVDVINWTATEAFHPADILNARNLDSDLENFEKVGEPMAEIQIRPFDGTTLDVFLMPYFTSPVFTSPASRVGFAPPGYDIRGWRRLLDRDGRLTNDRFGPQAAAQIRQVLGSADITLHVVSHMDRSQPLLVVDPMTFQPMLLYQSVTQVGGTFQQVLGPVIAKVEWAARWFVSPAAETSLAGVVPDRDHGIVAAGLEYGIVHGGGSESTFLLEGQTVLGVDRALARVLSPFSRDVLFGWRFASNDAAGRELFLGGIWDTEQREQFLVNLSAQQRLGDTWTVRAGLRLFQAPPPPAGTTPTGIAPLRNADHVRFTLTRHF